MRDKRDPRLLVVMVLLAFAPVRLVAGLGGAEAAGEGEGGTSSARSVAERLVAAFNDKAPAAMAELVSEDFELYYFGNDGKAALSTSGPEQLASQMTEYFKSFPDVRSFVDGVVEGPIFVSFRERVIIGSSSKSQSSLAVYEVRDGLIQRTWYFPAEGSMESTAKQEVLVRFNELAEAARSLDVDRYLEFFAEEFRGLNVDGTIVRSKQEFRDLYRQSVGAMAGYTSLDFPSVEVTEAGDGVVVLVNEYRAEVKLTSGDTVEVRGGGTQVWAKGSGRWLLVSVSSATQ